jgi:hypothetical protein
MRIALTCPLPLLQVSSAPQAGAAWGNTAAAQQHLLQQRKDEAAAVLLAPRMALDAAHEGGQIAAVEGSRCGACMRMWWHRGSAR